MSNTLLPCPFCGGEAVLTQEDCLGYYNDRIGHASDCELAALLKESEVEEDG